MTRRAPTSWAAVKRAVFERDEWTCQLCGRAIDRTLRFTDPAAGQVDHVVSVAYGGSDDLNNLQATHRVCNQAKGPSRRRASLPQPGAPTGLPVGFFRGVPDVDLTERLTAAVAELAAALVDQVLATLNGTPGPDRLLSVEEAADRLGIGRSAVYAEVAAGRLATLKIGRRRLVPEQSLAAFVARGRAA